MGTMFNIIVYHDSAAAAERAVDEAMAEIVRLDAVMSHYKQQSELSRLNREGRRGFVAVEPSLYEVLEVSVEFSRKSGGRFDVTIAPLLRVWKDAYAAGRRPSAQEIAEVRRCVGYQHIEMKPPNEIRFRSDCLELDLGGIGKGYAVDKALAVLESAGIRHAVVNAGGSTIGAIGAPPGLDGWPIDLGTESRPTQDHAASRWRGLDVAAAPAAAAVRAGAFGEIIDTRREAPIARETMVSVMTPSAARADALSTTLLLLPVQAGKRLLAQFSPVSALWISPAGELQDSYRPSRLRLADPR